MKKARRLAGFIVWVYGGCKSLELTEEREDRHEHKDQGNQTNYSKNVSVALSADQLRSDINAVWAYHSKGLSGMNE